MKFLVNFYGESTILDIANCNNLPQVTTQFNRFDFVDALDEDGEPICFNTKAVLRVKNVPKDPPKETED